MNSLERVLTSLDLQEPDRIPVLEWSVNKHVRNALCPGAGIFDFEEKMDMDGIVVYADYRREWLNGSTYLDEWGITLAETEEDFPVGIDFPLKEPGQLSELKIPDPCASRRFNSLTRAVQRFKGKRALFFRLRDAYSLPRYLRGMENLMMDFLLHPELVEALVNISVDYYTRMAYRAMELGADVFWTSDDYCDNRGPVMGVELWRKFILPGLRRLVSAITAEGYRFVKHCDGNILPILDDLVEAGISCIDPIDLGSGVTLREIKSKYGHRIAIKGGMPIDLLSNGTPESVTEGVRLCLQEGAVGGGYIFSSCSDVTAAVPSENFQAMLAANRRFGVCPVRPDRR